MGKGVVEALMIFCICVGFFVWGMWELIDWWFIDDSIRSSEIIIPEIELVIKNNAVDTVYVYRIK